MAKTKNGIIGTAWAMCLLLSGCAADQPDSANDSTTNQNVSDSNNSASSTNSDENANEGGWGDSSKNGLREVYTVDDINGGVLGNKIVFNSITDSEPIGGDERNFVAARENTENPTAETNHWNANDITVEDGKEYVIRAYVHNNNPLSSDAVATNTKVAFSIPSTSAKQVTVNGFIKADNAEPDEYWVSVRLNAEQDFHLEYVYDSALLENNGIGKGGMKLSDEIVTEATKGGVLIGYDALDGNIPGCYEYASYVTIRVKAVFNND